MLYNKTSIPDFALSFSSLCPFKFSSIQAIPEIVYFVFVVCVLSGTSGVVLSESTIFPSLSITITPVVFGWYIVFWIKLDCFAFISFPETIA